MQPPGREGYKYSMMKLFYVFIFLIASRQCPCSVFLPLAHAGWRRSSQNPARFAHDRERSPTLTYTYSPTYMVVRGDINQRTETNTHRQNFGMNSVPIFGPCYLFAVVIHLYARLWQPAARATPSTCGGTAATVASQAVGVVSRLGARHEHRSRGAAAIPS